MFRTFFFTAHMGQEKNDRCDYVPLYFPGEEKRQNVRKSIYLGKGIQFIRDEIKQFAKPRPLKNKFKIIMLYNDRLTVDAQSALRRALIF